MVECNTRSIAGNPTKLLAIAFFFSIACIPVTGLLWPYNVFSFRLNWIPLLFFPLAVLAYLYIKKSIPLLVRYYFLALIFYALVFFLNDGDYESLIRFFVSLLPLLFIEEISQETTSLRLSLFWNVYLFSLVVPLVLSILQLADLYPFYDSDEALWIVKEGRISGGYLKPNNLIVFIFPAFLWGLRALSQRNYLKGGLVVALCFFIAFTSTLRIAMVIYTIILACYFVPTLLSKGIDWYYRFWIPFFAGIVSFFALGYWFAHDGPVDGLRFRLPMWQAHAHHFLQAGFWTKLFGFSSVRLPEYYHQFTAIRYFEEAHNNSFRILTTFGLLGFTFYCLLIRKQVLRMKKSSTDGIHQFLSAACMLFFILYSVTNEPSFYVSVIWCITCWMFVGGNKESPSKKTQHYL